MTRLLVKGYNLGRAKGRGANTVTLRTMVKARNAGPRGMIRKDRQVVMEQEMDDDDQAPEWRMHRRLYPPGLYDSWPDPGQPGNHVPITIPRDLDTRGHRAVEVSDGLAKVTPDRYVTRRIAVTSKGPLAFVSFQLVAGAWTNPGQSHEAERRHLWNEGFAGAKRVIGDLAAKGITTVYQCDGNNPHMAKVHPREVRLVHRGLDYLGLVPGDLKVRVKDTGWADLNLDGHDLLWALLDV